MATSAPDTPVPGILRLSPALRRRIYLVFGLGHGYNKTTCEVYDLDGDDRLWSTAVVTDVTEWLFEPNPSESCFELGPSESPFPLLVSCRTIHDEAAALLYSSNWFVLHYRTRRSLASLRALTPPAVAKLINLRVVLSEASCHERKKQYESNGSCCHARGWVTCHPFARVREPVKAPKETPQKPRESVFTCRKEWHGRDRYHEPPLDGAGLDAQMLLQEWHSAMAALAPHVTPGALELSVVCDFSPDAAGVKAAKALLSSLRLLPRLKDCHIRLSRGRNAVLQDLAAEAVLQARGILATISQTVNPALLLRPPSSSTRPPRPLTLPRRLLTLPAELRLRILHHTDLITPWGEVYWSRGQPGFWFTTQLCDEITGRGRCAPAHHAGCRLVQCAQSKPYPHPSVGCFCRRWHAAASSACRCWQPPTALFLVCRALRDEAEGVFYGGNRFVVVDSQGPDTPAEWWWPGGYPHERLAASYFLRTVMPQHCLKKLRFLELVFAPFPCDEWPSKDHAAMRDWTQTVAWMRESLALPALTVRVAMAKGRLDHVDSAQRQLTQAQQEDVLAGYRRIVEPVARLGAGGEGGLGKFYAEMPWPWEAHHTGTNLVPLLDSPDGPMVVPFRPRDTVLKQEMERLSMGARYESVCAADRRPKQSTWFSVYLQDRGPNVAFVHQ